MILKQAGDLLSAFLGVELFEELVEIVEEPRGGRRNKMTNDSPGGHPTEHLLLCP